MILSGKEIERRRGSDMFIDPFDPKKLNPNSYNLTLADELVIYTGEYLDMAVDNAWRTIRLSEEGYQLEPNRLYLGRTNEYTITKNLVPMLEGRSSVGRLGLFVHVTAGFGDVGFEGYWTLEIHCVQPLVIYPGIDICQIYYHTIEGDYEPYDFGKYQRNCGIQTSQLWKEFQK